MLRLRVAVGVIASSASCAQLVGLDGTTGDARSGDTVALKRLSVGATVEMAPLDLTGLSASYLVANAASASGFDRVDATAGADGTWASLLRTPAPVELTLPGIPPVRVAIALPSTSLAVLFAALEHPDPAPPPDGAMLSVTATLEAPAAMTDSFDVFTVGSWTTHPLMPSVGDPMTVTETYAFDTSTSLSGRARLDRLTSRDAFLILRHSGEVLTGVAEAMSFDQTGTDIVSAMMAPVALDQTLDIKVDAAAIGKRYLAVRPAVATLEMSWSVVASPGYRYAGAVPPLGGFASGPVLNRGALMATDVGVTAMYGNPFVEKHGWNTLQTFATAERRLVTPAMMTLSVSLAAGTALYTEPSVGAPMSFDAGLPELITLDGKPLSSDGLMIAKPTRFVEVTFVSDIPDNRLYSMALFDLVPNPGGTALELHQVYAAVSDVAKFDIPPDVFVAGHAYAVRAVCSQGGFPSLAKGNLQDRQLPLSQAFLDSGTFTVMP